MKDTEALLDFFEKIQYNYGDDAVRNIEVLDYKTFDFLPEMALFSLSYIVHNTFERNSSTPKYFDDAICFYFKNVGFGKSDVQSEKPIVHIFPYSAMRISHFQKDENVQMLCLVIRIPYLKELLGEDAEKFDFLANNYQYFFMEEILTDDILHYVTEIIHAQPPELLPGFHYRIVALQLLFGLLKSLGNRGNMKTQKLNERDIAAIYKVKNTLIADLSHPVSIAELTKIAGMNTNKMRKLFAQIFGLGIYDYFQKYRMIEAARLLKDEQFSVSEVGYNLGFENLSHFTRVFESHIGIKPKAYSRLKEL